MSSHPSLKALVRLAVPLVFLFAGAHVALADTSADSVAVPVTPAAGPLAQPASLILNNREVVVFRTESLGYSPEQRVEAATKRLKDLIHEHTRDHTHITVETRQNELGWLFYVDGRWMFGLLPGDRDGLSGESFEDLVERTRLNLEDAVKASLEQRTTSRLIRSIVFSLMASILLWLLLRGLTELTKWSTRFVEKMIRIRTQRAGATYAPMIRQVGSVVRGVVRGLGIIIGIGLVDGWLTFVLKQFPYTYPWGDQIDDFLFRVLGGIGLGILRAIPNLVILVIIIMLARFAIRWVQLFFTAVKEERITLPGVDSETAVPAQRLVTLFLWVITIAVAYPFVPGSQGVAFKGLSVLLGLMLSLGSSNVVSQAASGYMLMFSKALRSNDYVRIGEHEGTVISVGMLSTKIRTPRDEEINVPNAVVVGTTIKNYTRLNTDTGAPVTTTVTIGYNAPWRQVHAMLIEAAEKTAGLRKEPAPSVLQTELSDFYVEYTLFARLEVPQTRARVLSELHANIQDMFNVHGVQIMSPHYEGDPDYKVWVPKDKWYESPARKHPDVSSESKGSE